MSRPHERLPLPVTRLLGDALDEAALARVHRRLDARRRAPTRSRSWMLAAAIAVGVLVAVALWVRTPTGHVPNAPSLLAPVALRSGGPLVAVFADEAPVVLALDDASTISLDRGARVSPLENGADRVGLLVERGRVRFEIAPGGPRRWTIDAGAATIEVVGTGFVVDRNASRVRVEVRHGVVLVRGERVADRVRRLEAGDTVEIPTAEVAPSSSSSSPAAAEPGAPVPSAPAWRTRASAGDYGEAYRLLGRGGIVAQTGSASVDDLFLLADVARLSGHGGEALAPLGRIVSDHAHDPRAPLAAFTLGKLQQSANPRAAASAFERAIGLGLSSSLRADAASRWLEACRRADDASCEERARRATGAPASSATGIPSP